MLLTIDAYNQQVKIRREAAAKSGIECPTCEKSELHWGDQNFMSLPPKRAVFCPRCNWRGAVGA